MTDSDRETSILMELVKERYGERLTEEQLEHISKSLKSVMDAGKALREIQLENSDEPFNVFRPYRRKE
jgi:hypothetical protein